MISPLFKARHSYVVMQLISEAGVKFRSQDHKTDYIFHSIIINTYSMKQPDLYYFETMKMTSQA